MKFKISLILTVLIASLVLMGCKKKPYVPEGFVLPTEPPNSEVMQPPSSPNE